MHLSYLLLKDRDKHVPIDEFGAHVMQIEIGGLKWNTMRVDYIIQNTSPTLHTTAVSCF